MNNIPENYDLLVGKDTESLTQDCKKLRELAQAGNLPTPDEVIAFLDGYNSFINHEPRPFSPMREVNMLL